MQKFYIVSNVVSKMTSSSYFLNNGKDLDNALGGIFLAFIFIGFWVCLCLDEARRTAMTPAQREAEERERKYWDDRRRAQDAERKAQREAREAREKRFR